MNIVWKTLICIDVLEWHASVITTRNIFEVNILSISDLWVTFNSSNIKRTDLRNQFSKVQEQSNEEREKKMACFKISFSYIWEKFK